MKRLNWIFSHSIKGKILTTLLTLQCFHWIFLNSNMYPRLTSIYILYLLVKWVCRICLMLTKDLFHIHGESSKTRQFHSVVISIWAEDFSPPCLLTSAPPQTYSMNSKSKQNTWVSFLFPCILLYNLAMETKMNTGCLLRDL